MRARGFASAILEWHNVVSLYSHVLVELRASSDSLICQCFDLHKYVISFSFRNLKVKH